MTNPAKMSGPSRTRFIVAMLIFLLPALIPEAAVCDERFGMSAMKRKQVWEDLVRAEDEARQRLPRDSTISLNQAVTLVRDLPIWPVVNQGSVSYIPKGTVVKALKKEKSDAGLFWYFVEGVRSRHEGWSNSLAMIQASGEWNQQLNKGTNRYSELKDRLEAEVGKKYGLSKEQLRKIKAEAVERDWPLPKESR